MNEQEAQSLVLDAAVWLDEKAAEGDAVQMNWRELINVRAVEIDSIDDCPMGQLFWHLAAEASGGASVSGFGWAISHWDNSTIPRAFFTMGCGPLLTAAWKRLLTAAQPG